MSQRRAQKLMANNRLANDAGRTTYDEVRRMELIDRILGLGPFLIPIIAIIVGGAIAIIAMVHAHQERLAKIERGIDPDASKR
jgi:hypothetical protein